MGKRGVVAFAFGTPSTIRSNQLISQIALVRARETGMPASPIFTQADIQFSRKLGLDVTYVEEKPGEPPPILRIARAAMQWAILKCIDDLVIVAAGPHIWRCLRDMKEAAKEIGSGGLRMNICQDPLIGRWAKENWFCPDSTQLRASSEKEWRKRERILELMPFFIYRLVAKWALNRNGQEILTNSLPVRHFLFSCFDPFLC